MSDEAEASGSPGEAPEATSEPEGAEAPIESSAAEPASEETATGGTALAVPDEAAVPAVPAAAPPWGTTDDPRVEQRKMRLWLPLLIPVGAIAVVALFTLNISRIFLVASEDSSTPAVLIASGITLAILVGATIIAALPQIRTSSLILTTVVILLVVMLAGSLVLGASLPKSEATAAFVEPTGRAVNTLEVDALPTLEFQAKEFDVPGGVNLIKYIDKGGTHTLVFDENAQPGFQLAVPDGKTASKVELKPDTSYTIYCTIPGHRQAGMEAEVKVGAKAVVPEPGTQSPVPTTTPPGTPTTSAPAGTLDTSPASQSNSGG